MTVKKLIDLLKEQPKDAEIFVSCQGFNNYSPKEKTYRQDDETYLLKKDGKLFITDTCYIDLYE